MMNKRFIYIGLGLLLLNFTPLAFSEDIDLFSGVPTSTASLPNVLIVLDNTANWSGAFTSEMAALSSVVSALPPDKFRVGIMMFTESGGANSGNDGGYVRASIRQLNAANKTAYQNLINSFNVISDKGSGGKAGKAMEEAYLYYAASAPYAGNNKAKTDYTGNTFGASQSTAVYAIASNALSTKSGSPYISPIKADCAKNFIIYISNGAVQDNNNDTADARNALAALGGNVTAIPISPSGSQNNISDEWARFMKKSALNITTYTVDINKVATGQGPGWSELLKSMASESSGRYFDVSSTGTQIADTLNNIFSEIQSVNSVFSSVSLPISINTQGTYLNQIYVGMFRPDPDSQPRWNGNLKQYKLGIVNGQLQLLDADSNPAINNSTGFITDCGRSFWTPSTLDSYWTFRPQGSCLTANSDASNYPDGNIVEKGAAAYALRSNASRNLQTCNLGACTALVPFNASNVSQTMLGAATTAERDALISWTTGVDIDDENLNGNFTEVRPSIHGDVVHSRPVAVNYGTDASPQIVVFYGGNDGILRAINGDRSAPIGSTQAGGEIWSFVAPDFFSKIKRNRDDTVRISFPGNSTGTPLPKPKDYGVDGSITNYRDSSSKSIFSSMRRGGRNIYAFDVTNVSSPVMKWNVGCPNANDDIGCTAGYSGMGQTWSSVTPIKSLGYGSGSNGMLITGGGYDICQDDDPDTSCTTASKGTSVYIMDMNTGKLLKSFATDSSVAADITVINDSVTGMIKYAYVVDMGGNIYRISGAGGNVPIANSPPNTWNMVKIAKLGGTGNSNRKFMFAPDVVEDGDYYYLLLGSGDREKPLINYSASSSVNNYFYFIKDKPLDITWLPSENSNCGDNLLCMNSLLMITGTTTPTTAQLAGKKGWALALGPAEQVVTSAITVFGTVTFSTHSPTIPSGSTCPTLGTAEVYNLNYKNSSSSVGTVRGQLIVGGGLPPSPVAGMVTLDNGQTVPFIVGASPNSPLQGGAPIPSSSTKRAKSRIYWYIKK